MSGPLQRRLVLLGAVVAVMNLASTPPASAQSAASSGGISRLAVRVVDDSLSVIDVFIACRHREAFTPGTKLNGFCTLALPSRRDQALPHAQRWITTVPPTPAELRAFRDTVRQQQVARLAAAARRDGVRGAAIGGAIVFDDTDGLPDATKAFLETDVVPVLRHMYDSLGVRRVFVSEYRDRSQRTRIDARRAAIAAVLKNLLLPRTIDFPPHPSDDPAARERVTLHPELPTIVANHAPHLAGLDFPRGEAVIGDPYRVSQAAGQIMDREDYRLGAMVVVYGYPDVPGDENLAKARAAALSRALADYGVAPERMIERVSETPRPAGTSAAANQTSAALPIVSGPASPLLGRPAAAQAPFSLSWEAVAQAAAEALVQRAEREVQQYVLGRFSESLCKEPMPLPQTCFVFRNPREGYVPTLETLRTLVRRDAEGFPERALTRLLNGRIPDEIRRLSWQNDSTAAEMNALRRRLSDTARVRPLVAADTAALQVLRTDSAAAVHALESYRTRAAREAESVVIALFAFQFGQRVHRGEQPLDVLSGFPAWLEGLTGKEELSFLANAERLQTMARFGDFLESTRTAASDLRTLSGLNVSPDTIFRYAALRKMAVLDSASRASWAASLAGVLDNHRQVEQLLTAADSLRRQIGGLQLRGDSTLAARRAAYAEAVTLLVRAGTAGFDSRASTLVPDTLARLQESLGELLHAINSRSYASVLQHSLALIWQVTPAAAGSGEDAGFWREQFRFLTLAVDISQAQTQDDVRGAMARFVDQGSSSNAKRSDANLWAVYLNAHVGAGRGVREGANPDYALRLPLGAEIVLGQPWKYWPQFTIFVQAIDLAGFLPQSGDAADRTNDERLAGVINPGAFLMISIGRDTPFSLGFGATPSRVIENERWQTRVRRVVHFGVDLPLVRLY